MTKKIVINNCFGGFGLSKKAMKRYLELKGKGCFFYKNKDKTYAKVNENEESWVLIFTLTKDFGDEIEIPKFIVGGQQTKEYEDFWSYYFSCRDIERDDKDLIKVIDEFGKEVNSNYSELKIIEIPKDVEYEIDEYDGMESIHEVHRSWG